MNAVLIPVLIVGCMGLVAGIILAIASKYMAVPADERVSEVIVVLPGVNCGACGFAGCEEYAERIVKDNVPTNLCTPGGGEVSRSISGLLGLPVLEVVPMKAQVRCSGDCSKATYVMDYGGKPTCYDCNSYFEGRISCSHACLGFGDCVKVCQYGAIYIENNLAVVDRDLCTGCGMCVKACPSDLISNRVISNQIFVACDSTDKGAFVRKICSAGCIGCGLCQKKCQYDAIVITNNLAEVNPDKCTNCGDCVAVCPTKVIKDYRAKRLT